MVPKLSPGRLVPALLLFLLSLSVVGASAGDLRVHIPKRTSPTPVQQLNREGVKAIEKHQYERARRLFFKAYLLDPNDPFTLNNLGYISELEGDVDRAQRFYDLAQQQQSDAIVDASSAKENVGKRVSQVAGNAADTTLQINRMNITAISLLLKDRAPEADLLLQKALKLDPKNPFTLNNLGYAKEKEGELEDALQNYTAAAALHSKEPIVVTVTREWRGKPISEVAGDNADKLRREMRKEQTLAAQVARLNLRGVSAMNRNDRKAARTDFQQAYKLDPNDSFTLNNMGFLAELDGDRETAETYYDKAREAKRNKEHITAATRRDVEGRRVGEVASTTDRQVEARMEAALEVKRRQGGEVILKRRDNTPVIEPIHAPAPIPEPPKPEASSNQPVAPAAPAAAPPKAPAANPVIIPEIPPENPSGPAIASPPQR
jgi:Flp pilus assembly protein TadD